MEQKFKETLRALIHGTKKYQLTWNYLSNRYYDDVEALYNEERETEDGLFYVSFDSAFEAIYDDLLLFIACADVENEGDELVGELYELRIYSYDAEQPIELESAILLYDSLDEQYEADLKNLFALAAGSASGVDKVMDKIIREFGEQSSEE
jgi:hypothetical protein